MHIQNVILGKEKFDLVIKNVSIVNVYTKEVYESEIGIVNGLIGHVNQPDDDSLEGIAYFDGKGMYAIPGLIDTHIHIESTMMTPTNLSNAIIPRGTTTLACDPHEIANVLGVEGVKYMVEASESIPLSVFTLLPSCVPSVENIETAGAEFYAEDISKMFEYERVIGLGEVMDFQGVINNAQRMNDILDVSKKYNGFIQGHAPGLTGRELSAYQAAGPNSDHEASFADEARYKLRAGMTLECRESSIVHDMPVLMPVIKELNYPENTTLCTDDKEPDDLMLEGHIDHVIRTGISLGGDPVELIKMATLNASKLIKMDDRGALAAGKKADVVLVSNLEEFQVKDVFISGEHVASNGKMINESVGKELKVESLNTVKLSKIESDTCFKIASNKDSIVTNVITYNPDMHIVTTCEEERIPVNNGYANISQRDDLSTLSVFERHGRTNNHQTAFVKNFKIKEGAIASTVSHDCHNLVVIGKNTDDMKVAANILISCGGGIVCVKNGEIIALVELPIAGLMSSDPIEVMAKSTNKLKEGIRSLGIDSVSPIIQVAAFSLPVIPHVRLTDKGLVDVIKQEIIPIIVE